MFIAVAAIPTAVAVGKHGGTASFLWGAVCALVIVGITLTVLGSINRHGFPSLRVEVLQDGYMGSFLLRQVRLTNLDREHKASLTITLYGRSARRAVSRRRCKQIASLVGNQEILGTHIGLDSETTVKGDLLYETDFALLDAPEWELEIKDHVSGKTATIPGTTGVYTPRS